MYVSRLSVLILIFIVVVGVRKVFHELVSPYEVVKVVSGFVDLKPLGVEVVSLRDGYGRVLAEDVYALSDYPPFDRSEVDGYAVNSDSLVGVEEDSPAKLRVKGSVKVGEKPQGEVSIGEALEIDTGAALPRGADSVVMVEYTKRVGEYVYVYASTHSGENVVRAGSDVMKGELLLRRGTVLRGFELATLAGAGVGRVKVYLKPKVGVVSIGSELVDVEEGYLPDFKIYEINSFNIIASLNELGVSSRYYGIVPDDYNLIKEVLSKALSENDLVITSGGTSAGLADLTYRVFNDLGEPGVIIHGLKIKPGKPTIVAVVNGKLLLGLPGFPLSSAMVFRLVATPIIAKLVGISESVIASTKVKAKLASRTLGSKGKVSLVPVALIRRGDGLRAYPIQTPSGSIKTLTYADGFIEISEDAWVVEEGVEVDVNLFRSFWQPPEIVFIGSHDYLIEELINSVTLGKNYKLINVGSLAGLIAVGKGEADIAGSHILDEATGEYNVTLIEKLGLRNNVVVARGWVREVGFIVPKGNPKNITSFKDLLRDDVIFVNRTKGSGIRSLIDIKLRELAKNLGVSFNDLVKKVRGYFNEAKTHTGVAASVAQGRADVGVGIKHAAYLYNLDFIKIGEEVYDIVIHRESLNKEVVSKIIDILRSSEFEDLIKKYVGYKKHLKTGDVIYE